jgi:hypothetical protein
MDQRPTPGKHLQSIGRNENEQGHAEGEKGPPSGTSGHK